MAEQRTVWIAEDGSVHATKTLAEKHEDHPRRIGAVAEWLYA